MARKRTTVEAAGQASKTNGTPPAEASATELYTEEAPLFLKVFEPPEKPNVSPPPEYISPEQAAEWLATFQYERQRTRYGPHVKDIANALANRQYSMQGIILCEINGEWRLTNGQHRLQAIVDSGIGAWEWVLRKYGLSEATGAEEYSRTDRGKRRQIADALRAHHPGAEYGLNDNQVNLISGAIVIIALHRAKTPSFREGIQRDTAFSLEPGSPGHLRFS